MSKFSVFLITILMSATAFAGYKEDLLNKMDTINTLNYKIYGNSEQFQRDMNAYQALYDKGNRTVACRQGVEAFQAPLKRIMRLTPPVYRTEILTPVTQPLSENQAKIILLQMAELDKSISGEKNFRRYKDLNELKAFNEDIATQANNVLKLPELDVLLPVKECGFAKK